MIATGIARLSQANDGPQTIARDSGVGRQGGVIMIAGSDGSGKTTLAHALAQTTLAGAPVLLVHHRRGIGALPRRKQPSGPTTEPHRHAPYPSVISLGKTFYLFADFLYGWFAKIRPFVRRGGWVILQRDWWDLLVDPRRYRLRSIPRLGRLLGRLLPQPDLTIVLDADPAAILARKAELPAEEIARQRAAWRELLTDESRVYLDAARPADEVLERATAELRRVIGEQGGSRHSPGWLAIPGARNARWLMPRGSRSMARRSFDVYQPTAVTARIGWEIGRAFASVGGFRLLPRSAAPPRAIRDLVDPYVPAGGSIAVMRRNHATGAIVLIVAADGSSVALAKLATDQSGQERLAREADSIERLGALLPHPLAAPRVLDRTGGALVMETPRPHPRWRPWRMPEEVAFALGAFYRAGSALDGANAGWGPSHGDCAPWNLLKTDDGWILIDWEEARSGRPPFYDLMHFLVRSSSLLRRPPTREIVNGVGGNRGWVGAAVAAYARGARLPVGEAWPHLLAYLESDPGDRHRQRVLSEIRDH